MPRKQKPPKQTAAEFRAQLAAEIAKSATSLDGVPVLPSEGTGSENALVMALADAIEALCVKEVPRGRDER